MATVLNVEKRTEIGKRHLKSMRKKGRVPGIIYGREMEQNILFSANEMDVKHIMMAHDQIVELAGIDDVAKQNALIKEIQSDTLTNHLLHVDLNIFKADEEVTLPVPITIKGEAIGVREDGGSFSLDLHEINVRCRLDNAPHEIVVDVTNLKMNEKLHVGDIVLPEGVAAETDADQTVASVVPPTVETEVDPTEEGVDSVQPEVLTERKDDTEGGS